MIYSPLRYPGGKNKLSKFVSLVCQKNHINGHYVEPYAGGASVALHLLINGIVREITINDYDRGIYAFWYCVLNNTSKFCKKIEDTEITIETWQKCKEILKRKDSVALFELGFAVFFLNRTNRSGIINAGVIGGLAQQGNYKMDCRFNKTELIERIKLIAEHKGNIYLENLDALDLINKIQNKTKSKNVLFYFDPPYYLKGESLYMNSYKHDDHLLVSQRIMNIKNARWLVSYDDTPEIQELYKNSNKIDYSFTHTAYQIRKGYESIFYSKNLIINTKDPISCSKKNQKAL
jgi:DNA adenine methylase